MAALIHRRQFIKETSLTYLFLSNITPTTGLRQKNQVTLFIDESNDLSSNIPFSLGGIVVKSPEKVESELNRLRASSNFKCNLKYSSTNKYKIPFAKQAIDYFFNEPDIIYHARVISGTLNSRNPNYLALRENIYFANYKEIVRTCGNDKQILQINLRNAGTDGNLANKLQSYLQKSILGTYDVKFTKLNSSNICQLADLFTGSIFGDVTKIESPVKVELLNYLKGKLKVQKMAELYNKSNTGKFTLTSATI